MVLNIQSDYFFQNSHLGQVKSHVTSNEVSDIENALENTLTEFDDLLARLRPYCKFYYQSIMIISAI